MSAATDAYYERLAEARRALAGPPPPGACPRCHQPLNQPGPLLEYGGGARQCHPGEPMPQPANVVPLHTDVVESPAQRTAMAQMALSAVLEVAGVALDNAAAIDAQALDTPTIVEALERLRSAEGIIAAFRIIERDLENALVAKLPVVESGRRKGKPQKWTEVPGYRIETTPSGQWRIDSTRALRRLFSDLADLGALDPVTAADVVTSHIGSLDTSWRTTELEESLGGKIEQPVLDDDGNPVLVSRGEHKGEPKTERISRLTEEGWGDREDGRTTVKIHRGEP